MQAPTRLLVACALLVAGCSSREASSERDPDRPFLAPADVVATESVALKRVGAISALPAAALQKPLTLGRWRAHLPASADGTLRLADATDPDVFLDVRSPLRPIPARRGARSLVFTEAAQGTDVVFGAVGGRVEELRVLRSPSALSTAEYELRLGPGLVHVRAREGRIEALDARGVVRFDTSLIVAIDAAGARLDPPLRVTEVERGRWSVVVDLRGLVGAFPIVLDPAWGPGGAMAKAREQHFAVRLATGKVLAGGGYTFGVGDPITTAELYDPATNTWAAAGAPGDLRQSPYTFPVALLPSGKVVATEAVDSIKTRLYDPATNSWTNLKDVPEPLSFHTLAPLSSGRVLLIGGISSSGTAPYERSKCWELDPVANTWTAVGSMSVARFGHVSAALPDGTVLVAGGRDNGAGQWSSAELYNPTTKTWSATGSMSTFHIFAQMGIMPSGKVLVTADPLEVYDVAGKTWTSISGGPVGPQANLPTGQIVVLSSTAPTLFDPSKSGAAAFTTLPAYPAGTGGVPTSLNDGRVLLSGGTTSAILFALDRGQSCGSGGQCLSGNCVDGVCCDTACTASCTACNVSGKIGTCSAIPAGEAPRGSRASCAPYFCAAGGACASTCAADTDCTTGNYCDGTTKKCLAKKANGAGCGRVGECTSGQCADGVCCNSACTGQCEACDLAAAKGTCSAVGGAPRGTRAACSTGTGKTCELQLCDGSDRTACHYPPVSTTCSGNACAAGIETHASTCDGAGACKDVPKDCGVYKCGATACKTTCGTKADCIAGYSCVGGACTPSIGLGKPCSDASACGDLLCVDGVCCGIDAPATKCADGYACNAPGKEGTCTLKNGSKCDLGSKCGSGNCVDGVCCDKACDGQCEACDVTGAVGTCTGVAGAPHGTRPACDAGGTGPDVCKARTCNGAADTKSCVGYVNDSSKLCAPKKCVGSDYTDFSFCDGAGTCKSPGASSCVPYKCDDTGCLKACTTAEQCADGFQCKDGKCVQGATCKDPTTSVSKDGKEENCGAYRCKSTGECGKECASSDDCAPGYACDGRACVPVAASGDTGDSGGCATGAPLPGRTAGLALFGLVALGVLRRRR